MLAAVLMARCTTTAKAALGGSTDKAAVCAATTLSSLGYDVEQRVDGEPLRALRQKHARGPINGAMDADRITVFLSEAHAGHEGAMRVVGETVRSGSPERLRSTRATQPVTGGDGYDMPTRTFASSEVSGDVQKVAGECGAGVTPK
jgi:hypothetical protein